MKPERKRRTSEKNNNSPSWRQAEFKGSPRQVYGGQGCKSGTESSSHPICGERGAMNLPFGNASAIKHRREGVQCSWAKRSGDRPGGRDPARGGEGGGLAPGEPADTVQPFPPQPPTQCPGTLLLHACPPGTGPAPPEHGTCWAGSLLMHGDGC